MLPMMFLPDTIRSAMEMMDVPEEKLKLRVYNVAAMSFTPAQLLEEMKPYYPDLTVEYEPDARQHIGENMYLLMPHNFKPENYSDCVLGPNIVTILKYSIILLNVSVTSLSNITH